MNREIKFRGKRVDMDRWVYGYYFLTPLTDENSGTTPDVGWCFLTGETRHCISEGICALVVDEKTVGQFTGLLDKNGKEIYEGDHFGEPNYPVEFIDGAFWHEGELLRDTCQSLEVIGNIHQNPELLK